MQLRRHSSTGLDFLDMRIGGGIPIDTVISVLAPPASQSQLMLRAITAGQPLVYLSTDVRDTAALEAWLGAVRDDPDNVSVYHTPVETLIEEVPTYLESASPESFVVIDTVNPLETGSRSAYCALLNDLHEWIREYESADFLHCLDTVEAASHRRISPSAWRPVKTP